MGKAEAHQETGEKIKRKRKKEIEEAIATAKYLE